MIDQLTAGLVGQRPNTYTFTKALAESMLLQLAGSLPVTIVRPSIGMYIFYNNIQSKHCMFYN